MPTLFVADETRSFAASGSVYPPAGSDVQMLRAVAVTLTIFLLLNALLCLDILMDTEADFIKEIRYLSGLMHQNCHDASWRMERLLSKVEQGESLDTRSTSIQLREARDELQQVMGGIEGIQKLCEQESDDS